MTSIKLMLLITTCFLFFDSMRQSKSTNISGNVQNFSGAKIPVVIASVKRTAMTDGAGYFPIADLNNSNRLEITCIKVV